jgi:hypothetical protein
MTRRTGDGLSQWFFSTVSARFFPANPAAKMSSRQAGRERPKPTAPFTFH